MNLVQRAFAHQLPPIIKWFPPSLRWAHAIQSLLYSRNVSIRKALKEVMKDFNGVLLDVGTGDGHFLFQLKKNRAKRIIALDKKGEWVSFLQKYQTRYGIIEQSQVEFHCSDLDRDFLTDEKEVSMILCFSVFPYLSDLNHVFTQFARMSAPGAKLLLYTPVDFKTVIPLYKYMFQRFQHYESMQSRGSLMDAEALTSLAAKHGFALRSGISTYGFWGKIGHECWSMSTMLLGSKNLFFQSLGLVSIPLTAPLTIVLGFVDRQSPIQHGNGWLAQFEFSANRSE